MTIRECRVTGCHVPPALNGDYCQAHWKMISLETRGVLLRLGRPGPGRNSTLRNKALFAAAREIREHVRGTNDRPAT